MKRLSSLLLALLLAPLSGAVHVPVAGAAVPDVEIRFRPHCAPPSPCQEFLPYDPETLITHGLKEGDTLDVNIVLMNPSQQPLQSVQSWVEYDVTVLKGLEVRITDQFPLVAPGEQAFSEGKGLVKLGASNVSGGMEDAEAVFARIKFQVLSTKADAAALRFHEYNLLGQEGRTKVLLIEEGRTVNVLKTRPKNLLLYFGEGAPPTMLPTLPPPPYPQPGTPPPSPVTTPGFPPPSIPDDGFGQLQPQNLRVATEEDRVYLAWDRIGDPRVAGYNVYYGTVSGRYIQRRTVGQETAGVTIRGLPVGKRYYFAVAAFDALERESQFSYEAAVTVGDPESSTAPLLVGDLEGFRQGEEEISEDLSASLLEGGRGGVPGRTGMPTMVLSLLLCIAALSSVLYVRFLRRCTLPHEQR